MEEPERESTYFSLLAVNDGTIVTIAKSHIDSFETLRNMMEDVGDTLLPETLVPLYQMSGWALRALVDYVETAVCGVVAEDATPVTAPELPVGYRKLDDPFLRPIPTETSATPVTPRDREWLERWVPDNDWTQLAKLMRAANILAHRHLCEEVLARALAERLEECVRSNDVRALIGELDDMTPHDRERIAWENTNIEYRH